MSDYFYSDDEYDGPASSEDGDDNENYEKPFNKVINGIVCSGIDMTNLFRVINKPRGNYHIHRIYSSEKGEVFMEFIIENCIGNLVQSMIIDITPKPGSKKLNLDDPIFLDDDNTEDKSSEESEDND